MSIGRQTLDSRFMRTASLILLKDPPQADPEVHNVDLGKLSDGIFVADSCPVDVVFGAIILLEFEKDEHGSYCLELLLSSVHLSSDGDVEAPKDAFDEVGKMTLHVARPDESWTTPRVVVVPARISLRFRSEADLLLWVVVDDEVGAEHPLLIRTGRSLPAPYEWS